MEIQFKHITFKNILSFGAKSTTIDFERGLNLIFGKNGSGKSSILDALSFCLFGQPYRKVKIGTLVNRKNKKGLSVECEFVVNKKDTFRIVRTLKPDSVQIFKNDKSLDLLSTKKLNQDEIDNIIGLNHQMFKQIISLAVNYNKPFLTMTAQEKRDIVESVFNIKVFGDMLKFVKEDNKEMKVQQRLNKNSVSISEENIRSLRKNLSELTEANKNFNEDKEKTLQSIDIRIDECITERNTLIDTIETLRTDMKSLPKFDDIKEIQDQIKNLNDSISKNNYTIDTSLTKLEEFNKHDICPFCNGEITGGHKLDYTADIDKIIGKTQAELDDLMKEKKLLDDKFNEKMDAKEKYSVSKSEVLRFVDKIKTIDDEISRIKIRKIEVEAKELDINLDRLQKEFDDKVKEYKVLAKETKSIDSNLKNNTILSEVLSESGIKAYFFKRLVPILNSKINQYIQLFELSSRLDFDEFMNETLYNSESLSTEVSYYSFSEGEKKRIDMSILMSFIEMTKIICNWNCNLLVIDELLDGAIDDDGMDKLLTSLESMVSDTKGTMCVYIISHKLQKDFSRFNSTIEMEKKGSGFSAMTVVE